MSKFIKTHFFYPFTSSLPTKQKGGKLKSWRKYTFGPYILKSFLFGPYISILPLLVPKTKNTFYFDHYRHFCLHNKY